MTLTGLLEHTAPTGTYVDTLLHMSIIGVGAGPVGPVLPNNFCLHLLLTYLALASFSHTLCVTLSVPCVTLTDLIFEV